MASCYRHANRETGLSCSECGRPICTECMTMAPVGIRCPEHSGVRTGPSAVASRAASSLRGAYVTRGLVILNVLVYLITVAQGAGLNTPGGRLYERGALYGPAVANGDWWRLITSAFLHGGLLHIAFNMLALWWLGSSVELALGSRRYLGLYLASGLAGSAGALQITPNAFTVGASGAIYGVLGALLILEYLATGSLAGNAMTLIVINLAFSFYASNISIGGHIGGLIGGIVCTLGLVAARRARQPLLGYGVIAAVAVASVLVAYTAV